MIIRRATIEDAEAICTVLRRSITELCGADHEGNAAYLERWLSNKTTANVRRWTRQSRLIVAEADGMILGVAAITDAGKVTLNAEMRHHVTKMQLVSLGSMITVAGLALGIAKLILP